MTDCTAAMQCRSATVLGSLWLCYICELLRSQISRSNSRAVNTSCMGSGRICCQALDPATHSQALEVSKYGFNHPKAVRLNLCCHRTRCLGRIQSPITMPFFRPGAIRPVFLPGPDSCPIQVQFCIAGTL